MKAIFDSFYDFVMTTIDNLGVYAPIFCCFLIMIESILPALPLCVFITVNYIAFGKVIGFFLSWVFTVIGCLISYFLVKKFLRNWIVTRIKNVNLLAKSMDYIENLSLTKVTTILAIPFTPAFMMNIAAGLTNMRFKKFFIAILISKIFLVYFWGNVGTSLLESIKNPKALITVGVMVIIAYLASVIVKKVFKVD